MDPLTISALIAGGSAVTSAFLNSRGNNKESKTQKTKRKLMDQILASLDGNGPYSDLFSTDMETFNKSFVEPAQAKFRNQIAPQIQQSYIQYGQQRGTGLDDQLLRAGVDMDSMLNQYLFDYQKSGLDRKQNAMNSILQSTGGAAAKTSDSDAIMRGAGGFLDSDAWKDIVDEYAKAKPEKETDASDAIKKTLPVRPGYAPDYSSQY